MKYKVGDKVRIKSLDWYNENKTTEGCLVCGESHINPEMICMLGKTVTISSVEGNHYRIKEYAWDWTDEMIEGLVEDECPQDFIEKYCKSCGTQRCDRTKEYLDGCPYYNAYRCTKQNNNMEEETKPKFKVGDEVRIKGTDIGGTIESVIRGQLIVNSKGSKIPAWPEDVVLMKSAEEELSLDKAGQMTDFEYEGLAYTLPEGYRFVDENGNEILTSKIILEKKKEVTYPKTYEECCEIMDCAVHPYITANEPGIVSYYEDDLNRGVLSLRKLLICRDAYWKIAGEDMGLGKPWELSIGTPIYYIYYNRTVGTIKNDYADDIQGNIILAFPTEEMRDAFYENFKELIESCKELL